MAAGLAFAGATGFGWVLDEVTAPPEHGATEASDCQTFSKYAGYTPCGPTVTKKEVKEVGQVATGCALGFAASGGTLPGTLYGCAGGLISDLWGAF
jgi:hypothetical protein